MPLVFFAAALNKSLREPAGTCDIRMSSKFKSLGNLHLVLVADFGLVGVEGRDRVPPRLVRVDLEVSIRRELILTPFLDGGAEEGVAGAIAEGP